MIRSKPTKTNPFPAHPLSQFNVKNNNKKPSAFVYDDDDNQPQQGSSELGDCRLPFAVPDSVNSKVK